MKYTEKDLPKGWYLEQVYDVAGDRGWVVFDQDREPMVHEFTERAALKAALEFAQEKGLLPKEEHLNHWALEPDYECPRCGEAVRSDDHGRMECTKCSWNTIH